MRAPDPGTVRSAIEALDTVRRGWLRRSGVAAVDVGFRIRRGQLTDEVAIRVHLERKLPREAVPEHELFPDEVRGVPVDVLEATYAASTGTPAAGEGVQEAADAVDRRARVLPLMGGVSIGNPRVTAGTLGAVVWLLADGTPHLLSNWHVLAGSEPRCVPAGGGRSRGQPHYQALTGPEPHYQALTGPEPHYQALTGPEPHYQALTGPEPHYQSASTGQPHYQSAVLGEPVLQPGRFDGGTGADVVARLSALRLDRHMDAALARITGARPYATEVLGIGPVAGVEPAPRLGMRVRKSGRSTGVTEGVVDGVSLSTTLTFPHGDQRFDDQLHIVPPGPWPDGGPDVEVSDGGDSGSVWVDAETGLAVGLHFAGEEEPGMDEHALANPMWRVAEALGFTFTPVLHVAPHEPAARPPARPAEAARERVRHHLEEALRALD